MSNVSVFLQRNSMMIYWIKNENSKSPSNLNPAKKAVTSIWILLPSILEKKLPFSIIINTNLWIGHWIEEISTI